MSLPELLLAPLERALNASLADSLRAQQLTNKLSGSICEIYLRDWDSHFYLLPQKNQRISLQATLDPAIKPDVTISGTLPALARATVTQHPDRITINGDAALAQSFQHLLREVDFDWQENLAKLLGDVPAQQIGRSVRAFFQWEEQARNTLADTFNQYLHEEAALLPPRMEVDRFMQQIDALRDDLARCEARLQRLESYS